MVKVYKPHSITILEPLGSGIKVQTIRTYLEFNDSPAARVWARILGDD